jgi:hypothetical protein
MRNLQTISGLICIIILFFLIDACTGVNRKPASISGKSIYVSADGDDENSGTIVKPLKSIDKLNSLIFEPGDRILFEGEKVFKGTIKLDSLDKGLAGNKVIISSYGTGEAIIDGGDSEAIIVTNCEEFVLKNLRLTGKGRKEGNTKDGLYISNSSKYIIDSIEVLGFQHSGIHVFKGRDIEIKHVYAHDNGFAGINLTGTTIYSKTDFDNENIYIGYCISDNNPGDPTVTGNHSGNGILVSSARKCIIEYCEASNNGWDMPWTGNGPVGIWIWDCNNVIIQHCISHHNKTNPVAKDGGGFDLDGGVSESVIQYCVSYNNMGAGYGLFEFGAGKPWENNIIRYNISSNDGLINPGSVSVWKGDGSGVMMNCEIYNNTFLNDTAAGVSLNFLNNCEGFNFRNNIFIYSKNLLFPGQKLKTEQFQGNCYWNSSADKSFLGFRDLKAWANVTGNEMIDGWFTGIYADPLLLLPRELSLTDPSVINFSFLSGYSLKQGSPLIDKALDLKTIFNQIVGNEDLIGTNIPQKSGYDVGAIEFFKH